MPPPPPHIPDEPQPAPPPRPRWGWLLMAVIAAALTFAWIGGDWVQAAATGAPPGR